MAQPMMSPRPIIEGVEPIPSAAVREIKVTSPSYVAFWILHIGFIVLPIVAGLDKFFHLLVNWDQYLSPLFASPLGGDVHMIMTGVGIVEIVAGLVVAVAPQVGGYLVMLWLWGIIANLLTIPAYFDIALRDFGLSLAALALAQLGSMYRER